jgi:hypothetical protein
VSEKQASAAKVESLLQRAQIEHTDAVASGGSAFVCVAFCVFFFG